LENILVASLLVAEDLEEVLVCLDDYPLADDPEDLVEYWRGKPVDLLSHTQKK